MGALVFYFFDRCRTLLFCALLLAGILSAQTTIDTRIPSSAAGSEGIFTRIYLPLMPRFGVEGSPVVIHVPGGFNSGGVGPGNSILRLPDCFQIQFNFPGGGYNDKKSGGTFDERGPNCLLALRDVIRFALGIIADQNGKKFSEMSGLIKPMPTNVGLVGFSNGGNATIATAGIHGAQIPGLAWIMNWESPVGDGMPNAECGVVEKGGQGSAANPRVNPAYNPNTGAFDLSTLAFDDTLHLNWTKPMLKGGLYFDINQNKKIDWGIDFVLNPHEVQIGGKSLFYYSVRVICEAQRRAILPKPLPVHIADSTATKEFWQPRNGQYWIAQAVQHNPRLMFIVEASEEDHVQSAPDHPHVLIQYEGFRQAGARFVRLNPDRAYVEAELGRPAPTVPDNDAFYVFDHLNIRNALEPAGEHGIATMVGQVAAIYELIDRTYYNNLSPQLSGVITRIHESTGSLPNGFILEQNYPNPFNSTTTICFSLPQTAKTTLKVIDLKGREVATLVGNTLPPGMYSVDFNADDLVSGPYFYILQVGSMISVKKMILLR